MKIHKKPILLALLFFFTFPLFCAQKGSPKFKPIPPTEQELNFEFEKIVGINKQIASDVTPLVLGCKNEVEIAKTLYRQVKIWGEWGIRYSMDSSEKSTVRTAIDVYRDKKGDCNEISSLLYGTYRYAVTTLYDKDPDLRPCFVAATIFQELPENYQYDIWFTENDDVVTNESGKPGILRYHMYFALLSTRPRAGWEKRIDPDFDGPVYLYTIDPTSIERGPSPTFRYSKTSLLVDKQDIIAIYYQDAMASAIKSKNAEMFSMYLKKYKKFKK